MDFTVHWEVNDGRFGYPNIQADLAWSDVSCRTYEEAIRAHAKQKGVHKIVSISETNSKGKINGRSYRDFLVSYLNKNVTQEKEIYIGDELVQKIIRVFGSQTKPKKTMVRELYPA
ncbi:MAG: hypothetical protein A4E53_02659 [Pelotomaculum sp. PtaB.Bin104]|nr:MAG: hypothetical protein A4E53_02659 [Pelotomaculum sp. PtaB.Bin104]